MRRPFWWWCSCLFVMLWSARGHAWNIADHQSLTSKSLAAVSTAWNLQQPVYVTAWADFLQHIAPRLGIAPTSLAFALWMETDPAIALGHLGTDEYPGQHTTPLQILVAHVADPDDGRDNHLYLRDANGQIVHDADGNATPRYPHLAFMGGPDSQAYRHMERPPFSLAHWKSTLGFPLGTFGMASTQAQRYFDLALMARAVGEPYWAWRFIAGALHYVQDLGQPYHGAQFPWCSPYALLTVQWWRAQQQLGLIAVGTRLLSNSHLWFEDFTAQITHNTAPVFTHDARTASLHTALNGTNTFEMSHRSIRDLARFIRDDSNQRVLDLVDAVFWMSGPRLLSLYEYPQSGDNPSDFLRTEPDEHFTHALDDYFRITAAALAESATATRTLVKAAREAGM